MRWFVVPVFSLLVACSADKPESDAADPTSTPEVIEKTGVNPVADGVKGVLGIEGRCAFLQDNGSRVGLLLPSGARVREDGITLSERVLRKGDYYHIAGNLVENRDHPDSACPDDYILNVMNVTNAPE